MQSGAGSVGAQVPVTDPVALLKMTPKSEVKYQPPFWLHAALWLPLILATTLLPMRSMKSLLIALQFHHKAAEGRLERKPGA